MRVLVVGCGYVGLPLAVRLAGLGHQVFGLRRHPPAEEFLAMGITPLSADITDSASLAAIPADLDWVVNCTSAGGGSVEDYRAIYLDGTRNLLRWLAPSRLAAFLYTSSTGVYAQDDGAWLDETSVAEPASPTGRVLIEAERLVLDSARSGTAKAIVLRVAGIYGPGRGYWLKTFMSGEARLEGDGSRFLNMVHRDDVGSAILGALERGQNGEIYNVVDDEPVTQRGLLEWLASKTGRPLPESSPAGPLSPRKRAATNKRVSNAKLKRQVLPSLTYPTFREGFKALLTGGASGDA